MHTTAFHLCAAMGLEPAMSTNTGARRTLRRLELEAYASVVSAFRAQGRLTGEKKSALDLLSKHFGISSERHRAEVRRAVNDDLLSSVAYCITGMETDKAWRKEGQKLASTNPRFVSRQITNLPQVLTSAAITATFGSQLGSNKPSSNVSQGSTDLAPAKKMPATSSQLQSALKLIISQNPLASTKLSDVITSKNQSPVKQQSSPVAQTTSAESQTPPSIKITSSPQKVAVSTKNVPSSQKTASSPHKAIPSPHKVTTSPMKVTTTPQKSAISTQTKPVKLPSNILTKTVSSGGGTEHSSGSTQVKVVSKIESLLCEETLSMDTSPSKDQKPSPSSGVKIKTSTTSAVSQSKLTRKEKSTETDTPKLAVSVARMLSAPLKESTTVEVQEKKETMDVSTSVEKIIKENELTMKSSTVKLTVLPTPATTEKEEKLPPITPSVTDGGKDEKDTSTQAGGVSVQKSAATATTTVSVQKSTATSSTATASVSLPVTTSTVPITSTSLSSSLSSVSTSTTVTSTSVSEILLPSEATKENRKRSLPPLDEAVPPPKKPNTAPLILSLSESKPDQTIPKAGLIPLQLSMPISSSPAPTTPPIPVPTTPPIPVPTTPLPVEVPTTPLTPASIQEFSELDPTAENLIDALCSDPSNVDDSTLASQLGLDSVDSTVMNLNEFLNMIQPENVVATPQTTDGLQLGGSSVSESETLVKSSFVVEDKPAAKSIPPTSEKQENSTAGGDPSPKTEVVPMTAHSTHTPKKAPSFHLPVTAQVLPSTTIAASLPLSVSLPSLSISSLDPTPLSKPEILPTTSVVTTMMSPAQPVTTTVTALAQRTESLPSKPSDPPSSSGLLDFTDIGSILGLEEKLLEDIPEELAESIHALAMLDEKSTRVTWKQ